MIYELFDTMPKIFEEVIESDAMKRIDRVDMNCSLMYTSVPFFQTISMFSRYQHSLGVGLLAYYFTNDEKQALAALFHDIATPAFSHVVDFMNGDHLKQESTETRTVFMIKSNDIIMQTLNKHHIALEEVCDYHKYPICDNDSPKLSCDRLEYTLSNMVNYHISNNEKAKELLKDIIVSKNESNEDELVFKHFECALEFARYALACSKIYVQDIDRYAMEYLALLLKKAQEKKIITIDDLYQDDQTVIDLLLHSSMKEEWIRFTKLKDVEIVYDCNEIDVLYVNAKRRFINPYVLGKGRVLDLDETLNQEVNAFINESYDYGMRGIFNE